MANKKPVLEEIPAAVREYLSSADETGRLLLFDRYPELKKQLDAPETRQAILRWLTTEEAWAAPAAGFTAGTLQFLRAGAKADEAHAIRPFLLHVDPFVRLRAHEHLLTLYFPDKNREGMFLVLHGMLSDADDRVRTAGAYYIDRAGAVDELREFLERWHKEATSRGWEETECFEVVERLLEQ